MRITLPEALIPLVLRARNANRPFVTEQGAHDRIRERFLRPVQYGPPARLEGVRVDRRLSDPTEWPVYDVRPVGSARPEAASSSVVVYVHGGGWVNEITGPHWKLIARIARETGQRVVVPIHPLVPLGTARDVRDGVVDLVRREEGSGCAVRMAGDSSGGQIVLSAVLALRDDGRVLPSTVLLSPALDLTWSNPLIDEVQPGDPWLGRPGGRVLAEAWRGDDFLEDPAVSPLFGDMAGVGPLTILSGTHDVLNPDAHVLGEKAQAAGVQVTLHEAEGQLHVFALLPTEVGDQGARRIIEALRPDQRGPGRRGPSQRGPGQRGPDQTS